METEDQVQVWQIRAQIHKFWILGLQEFQNPRPALERILHDFDIMFLQEKLWGSLATPATPIRLAEIMMNKEF